MSSTIEEPTVSCLRCSRETAAVLFIDVQEYYVSQLDPLIRDRLITACEELAHLCVSYNLPAVTVEHRDFGPYVVELMSQVMRIPRHHRVSKVSSDGFEEASLDAALKEWGITTLIMAGLYGAVCVKATALSAIQEGYDLITARDLIVWDPFSANPYCKWDRYGSMVEDHTQLETLFVS